jgi:hypothetical protein
MRYIVYFFIFLILYRFWGRFILPIFHVSRMAGERMRQMQRQMEEMQKKTTHAPNRKQANPPEKDGDYIDYEEVK